MLDKSDTILVTGATGFLGSHLMRNLVANGYNDIVATCGTSERSETEKRMLFDDTNIWPWRYDLMSTDDVSELFRLNKPDVVIHLAGNVGGILKNKNHPGTLFRDNIKMGINLIEESRKQGVKKFILLSTICSYPKFTPVPFRETDIWKDFPEETNAPYAIAKKSLMVMLDAYRQEFGLNGVCLIPVNMYGPRDNFHVLDSHVIPSLIRKFYEAKHLDAESVTLWGTGEASREFLYVEDCAEAIRLALENYNGAEPVNIGTGHEIKICDLAEMIAAKLDYHGKVEYDTTKPDGQPRRCLDISRAKKFGFEAKTTLSEGLDKTIEWYKQFQPQ